MSLCKETLSNTLAHDIIGLTNVHLEMINDALWNLFSKMCLFKPTEHLSSSSRNA